MVKAFQQHPQWTMVSDVWQSYTFEIWILIQIILLLHTVHVCMGYPPAWLGDNMTISYTNAGCIIHCCEMHVRVLDIVHDHLITLIFSWWYRQFQKGVLLIQKWELHVILVLPINSISMTFQQNWIRIKIRK